MMIETATPANPTRLRVEELACNERTRAAGHRTMSPQHIAVRPALAVLVLLCGACSVNPYRTPSAKRSVPTPPSTSATTAAASDVGAASSANLADNTDLARSNRPLLERVATAAQRMIGVPYVYGGESPRGFDCSGLVFYAYREAGVSVPRTSREQLRASRRLEFEQALPGDLVFFSTSEKASHVGIYLGGQRFVHAPSGGKAVVVDRLDQQYYRHRFIQLARLRAVD